MGNRNVIAMRNSYEKTKSSRLNLPEKTDYLSSLDGLLEIFVNFCLSSDRITSLAALLLEVFRDCHIRLFSFTNLSKTALQ